MQGGSAIDSHKVMEIFCQDTKLNLSPVLHEARIRLRRLVPAQGRAGADLQGADLDLDLPDPERDPAEQRAADRAGHRMIVDTGQQERSAFSASPSRPAPTTCASQPAGGGDRAADRQGLRLQLYDSNVSLAALTGANRDYILNHIPHISRLMVESMEEVMDVMPRPS